VTLRDQGDTRANILTMREEYQRKAVKDRAGAQADYFQLIDALGPGANMSPEEITKDKQGFKEGAAYTEAFSMVRSASRDLGAVRKAREALGGDGFKDIDPQRKAALDAELDRYEMNILQRQELAAAQAARKAEAHMRHAESAFNAAQARMMSGIPESDAQAQQTIAALTGTPYLETYRAVMQQARASGGFAAQPIAMQQRAVDALYARRSQEGSSEELDKQISMAERVLSAAKSGVKDDALRAYSQRYPGEAIEPIDISTPQAAIASLQTRMGLAHRASAWSGSAVSPLTSDEAQQFGQMLEALPVQQRATALGTLGRSIGPQAAAGLAAQIDKKDKALALALQFGTSATTEGRTTAEIILKGQQALKDRTVKVETMAVDGWRSSIAKEIDGAYSNQKQAEDVKEAAFLIMAGLESDRSGRSYKEAVGLAARGRIVEHNGKRIPLPAGVTQDDLDTKLRSLTPQNFTAQAPGGEVRVGGQAVPLETFVQSLPDAQLINSGYGRYNVLQGGRVVTNAQGMPITITAK
jgi:hypothetical protein